MDQEAIWSGETRRGMLVDLKKYVSPDLWASISNMGMYLEILESVGGELSIDQINQLHINDDLKLKMLYRHINRDELVAICCDFICHVLDQCANTNKVTCRKIVKQVRCGNSDLATIREGLENLDFSENQTTTQLIAKAFEFLSDEFFAPKNVASKLRSAIYWNKNNQSLEHANLELKWQLRHLTLAIARRDSAS